MDKIFNFFVAMPILIILLIALRIAIAILIIRLICQYMAKQNAKAFNYEYLAIRTAEEICKRQMIIEGQKAAYKGATNSAENQSRGGRDGNTEQFSSW